jgi:molecular chaperone DnaK
VSVSAKDKATGKEQQIKLDKNSTKLSKEEIDRMKQEAEANAANDAQRKEEAEKINAADTLIFSTEKQLKEYADKIPADKKQAIETALAQLKTAHEAKDLATMDTAVEALNAAWQAASQDMYAAASEAAPSEDGQQPADSTEPKKDNDATDVEFEEVK